MYLQVLATDVATATKVTSLGTSGLPVTYLTCEVRPTNRLADSPVRVPVLDLLFKTDPKPPF